MMLHGGIYIGEICNQFQISKLAEISRFCRPFAEGFVSWVSKVVKQANHDPSYITCRI